jgi:hypothetical protein
MKKRFFQTVLLAMALIAGLTVLGCDDVTDTLEQLSIIDAWVDANGSEYNFKSDGVVEMGQNGIPVFKGTYTLSGDHKVTISFTHAHGAALPVAPGFTATTWYSKTEFFQTYDAYLTTTYPGIDMDDLDAISADNTNPAHFDAFMRKTYGGIFDLEQTYAYTIQGNTLTMTEQTDPPSTPITFLRKSSLTAPAITTASLPGGTAGEAYSQTLTATGSTPLIWTLAPGSSLPAGLTLATTGVLSGTPTATGTFTFTVKAANRVGSDTKALSITITAAPVTSAVITTASLPDGTVGTPYSATLTADGVTPITWTLEPGSSLPDGLTLDEDSGEISGTPTTAGSFQFTMNATNTDGGDTKLLEITIN